MRRHPTQVMRFARVTALQSPRLVALRLSRRGRGRSLPRRISSASCFGRLTRGVPRDGPACNRGPLGGLLGFASPVVPHSVLCGGATWASGSSEAACPPP